MNIDDCSTFEYGEEDFIRHTASWTDKEAPQLSKFDTELQQKWDHAMANGAFRYDISNIQTRILPGPSGYVAQLNTMRAIARRAPQKIVSVQQPFNPKEFHFNKVKPIEVIFHLSKSSPKSRKEMTKRANCYIYDDSGNSVQQNGINTCDNEKFSSKDQGMDYRKAKGTLSNISNDNISNISTSNGTMLCHHPVVHGDEHSSADSNNKPEDTKKSNPTPASNGLNCATKEDHSHMLIINVSPMEYGHCLLVPNRNLCLPQVMTEESYVVAIETMLLSRHRGLRMGFNSLCAFASVNHLHLHMFYLEYELISDFCAVRHLAGMYHEYTALPCPGFALQLHGTTVQELARQASRISNYLYENNIAHNMFMCRGVVFGEERNSKLTTIRLFIWPREKCIAGNKSSEEFNVACIELVGHLPVKIEDGFKNLTEPDVNAILANARLPQEEYEAIKAVVMEMGKEEDHPKVELPEVRPELH